MVEKNNLKLGQHPPRSHTVNGSRSAVTCNFSRIPCKEAVQAFWKRKRIVLAGVRAQWIGGRVGSWTRSALSGDRSCAYCCAMQQKYIDLQHFLFSSSRRTIVTAAPLRNVAAGRRLDFRFLPSRIHVERSSTAVSIRCPLDLCMSLRYAGR